MMSFLWVFRPKVKLQTTLIIICIRSKHAIILYDDQKRKRSNIYLKVYYTLTGGTYVQAISVNLPSRSTQVKMIASEIKWKSARTWKIRRRKCMITCWWSITIETAGGKNWEIISSPYQISMQQQYLFMIYIFCGMRKHNSIL